MNRKSEIFIDIKVELSLKDVNKWERLYYILNQLSQFKRKIIGFEFELTIYDDMNEDL